MKKTVKIVCFVLAIVTVPVSTFCQSVRAKSVDSKTGAFFRSASVVSDDVIWVSGSKGTVGYSKDGGEKWIFHQVANFEHLEFRTLYAFDSLTAIIANAGSPAYILRTTDRGANWRVVYTNNEKDAFFDGIDFWNKKEGLIYGDAIQGKMLLLKTNDGGITWKEVAKEKSPALKQGEGSFAASGTGIRCFENNRAVIATGGVFSRLWFSKDKGNTWTVNEPPIVQGQTMTGIYSVAFRDTLNGIVVGGNYNKPTEKIKHILFTQDGGETWNAPITPTRGMRECVEYITPNFVIACGQSGIDISNDGGKNWKAFSNEKQFSVVRKSRDGSIVVLAGANGRISILSLTF
jgi:photosystem II stability/assembly factor-like uncharacterized protein